MSRSYRLASAAGILPKCYTRPVQRSAPLNAPLNAPFASRRLRAVPKQPHRSTPRRKWLNDVRDALSSSLDLREVFTATEPLIQQLVSADHIALGVSSSNQSVDLDWLASSGTERFFACYAEMATEDFVFDAVARSPTRVLRDSQMLPRKQFEQSTLHRRSRELDVRIEQVMGVMLHQAPTWSSGVSVYRSSRRPFTDNEQHLLQELVPAWSNAVRNCHAFERQSVRGIVLETLLADDGRGAIVLTDGGVEVTRSALANDLLARWFSPLESSGRLPLPLRQLVGDWVLSGGLLGPAPVWTRASGCAQLTVHPHALVQGTRVFLALVLEQKPLEAEAPSDWQKRLTPRQYQVVTRVLRGWDNQMIADDLGCALNTIKKHLTDSFTRLGIDNRVQLIVRSRSRPS